MSLRPSSAIALLAVLALPLTAFAYGGGVVGFSGKVSTQLCSGCHLAGAGAAPTVTLTGPATLNAGQTGSFSLTITGGPGVRGGMNVAVSGTAAVLNAGAGSAKESGELRHASPLAFGGGSVTWNFTVTAPTTAGSFTLFGAGNSCNGSGNAGDRSAYVTKAVTVMVVNQPPTVSIAAGAAATSPTTRALSVGATDDAGEAALTYTWATTTAPAPVSFSVNGTNAAKNTSATFTRAGDYVFSVTVRDAAGLLAVSTVNVTVAPQVVTVAVSPSMVGLATGRTQQFTAAGTDQFGLPMTPGPTFAWSATGGTINATTGLFTAPATAGGPFTVTAASSGRMGTAQVTVSVGTPPTVATAAAASGSPVTTTSTTLTVLGADDGGEAALRYTWAAGAGVSFSVNGSNAAKRTVATFTAAGSVPVTVTIRDAAGLTVTSAVTVMVDARLQNLAVSPATAVIPLTGTQQFTVEAEDQFGTPITPAPSVSWAAPGSAGTITSAGLFRASNVAGGPFTITATGAGQTGTATVSVASGGAPTLVSMPSAFPPSVMGKSTVLRVLGSAESGEATVQYEWTAAGPAPVSFAENDSNAAKNTTATFSKAGAYTLTATLTSVAGMTTTATVEVTVAQSLSALSVMPSQLGVAPDATQRFSALATDQFGDPHAMAPAVMWSLSGGGTIDDGGLFTARGTAGGPFTVTANAGALRGMAAVTVGDDVVDTTPPSIAFRGLGDGAVLKGNVKLQVVASDNIAVTEVAWLLDGAQLGVVTSAPFAFVLQSETLPLGPHTLEAIASDAAGSTARTPAIEVIIARREDGGLLVGTVGCSSAAGSAPLFAATLMMLALSRRRQRVSAEPLG
ncbi:MAG: choice-of-anchor V domain-containing protein [Myxococcales bacterium]|nr:choice-of-anchor V domain-containing protein [Myxococcales bacterium]